LKESAAGSQNWENAALQGKNRYTSQGECHQLVDPKNHLSAK
jgi:hypothetical protein